MAVLTEEKREKQDGMQKSLINEIARGYQREQEAQQQQQQQ